MWEIQGNVIRDLASLNRVETLPWDNWGLIPKHYSQLSEAELALLDAAARIGARSGPLDDAVALYRNSPELLAPDVLPV